MEAAVLGDHQGTARPLADFHPTVWGDFFVQQYSSASQNQQQKDHAQTQHSLVRLETLKEEVRMMFSTNSTAHGGRGALEEEIKLVDAVQRLGLAYHFEEEISKALARIHVSSTTVDSEDLQIVSLRFRLLRQGGYNISSNEFNKFKDVHGHFKGSLSSGVKGLLSLYEASYLGTQEDGILEEAMSFCRTELESMLDRLQPALATEVVRALDMPLVRKMKRLEVREYLSFYEASEGRNDTLLELAKLDFNSTQSLHQEEIRDLTRWWRKLGLIEKLNFARDRLVESYLWILGVHYEPHLAHVRIVMTKIMCLTTILDDTYDSYGTLVELRLLTDIIQRWDIGEVEGLVPEYIKTYFMALCDMLNEFELESYPVQYIKEELKAQSKAYLKEAEWCNEGSVPTLHDHLQVSKTSIAVRLTFCGFFICMGDVATQDTFDWLAGNPRIVEAACIIGRLANDLAEHELQANRRHVASTVQCYMKEHDVSKEVARQKLREMVDTAWKVMNEEWIQLTQIPTQLLAIFFEFSRTMEVIYQGGTDKYTDSYATNDLVSLLLVKQVPL